MRKLNEIKKPEAMPMRKRNEIQDREAIQEIKHKKQIKSRKNKSLLLLAAAFMLMLTLTACGRDFDAAGYVEAALDQMFQGDVTKAAGFREGVSKAELEAQHDAVIEIFVDNNIIGGMNVSELMRADFIAVCDQMFAIMRYEVLEAEKIDRKNYEVTVEIAPVDIFPRFVKAVKEDSEEIMQKAKNGEYKGTEEEIAAQMNNEFIRHSNELLKTYTEEASYGEKVKVKVGAKADKKKEFSIVSEDLDQLIIKILRLDEIQD